MAVTAPAAGVSDQGARQAIAEQRCVEVVERRLELAQGLAGWIDLSRGAHGHICIVLYNLSRVRHKHSACKAVRATQHAEHKNIT